MSGQGSCRLGATLEGGTSGLVGKMARNEMYVHTRAHSRYVCVLREQKGRVYL